MRSPVWWVEFTNAAGERCREKVSADKAAAEYRRAEIVREVERAKVGLPSLTAAPSVVAITSLADEYRDHLASKGRTGKHVALTRQRIGSVVADCGWARVQDVKPAAWLKWVAAQRADGGLSAESCNHHLRAVRGMFRWLVREERLAADPLASVEPLNADAARVLVRRVLGPDDFRRLILVTRESPKSRLGLSGSARAALYLTAARTGLRAGVLAQLGPDGLRLDDDLPHIPTQARQQKNRKTLRVPISPDLLAELRSWISARPAGELLWPGNWHAHHAAAKMLRKDLKAADIPAVTADGSFDFHALRAQCGTDLARAGVSLSVAQQFLGHSTPALTAKHYTRLGLADLKAAADRLGSELGSSEVDDVRLRTKTRGESEKGKGDKPNLDADLPE